MAVTRHSNFDITVNTIADRNSIVKKVDGMVVTVLDAIADVEAGSGKAIYRWVGSDSTWALLFKSTFESISYSTEELLIVNGKVTASNYPIDNVIWDISIVDGNVQLAILRLEDLSITNGVINLGSNTYNGKKLRFTFAYGSISAQLNSVLDGKVSVTDNVIGSY